MPAWQPLTGAALGLLTAVVLGYLLYRGAVRINLSRFFTWTGGFLIVIAAGVLGYGIHDLQEAGILPGLNSLAFDVSGTVDEGSWYGTVLKGVFNFSAQTTWLQAIAWTALPRDHDDALPAWRTPSRAVPGSLAADRSLRQADRLTTVRPRVTPMRFTLPLAALLAGPLLAACTENATTDNVAAGDGGPISVTATDDACEVSTASAPAGPLTFEVTNSGSKVTEFYLYSGDGKRIVGEVENIGPGLQGKLIVTAQEGAYLAACKPGMSGEGIRSEFTVTEPEDGAAAPSGPGAVSRAQNDYRVWVQRQSDVLVARHRGLRGGVPEGERRPRAPALPARRTPWEAIETVAESFGDLDPKTDAREADLSPARSGPAGTGSRRTSGRSERRTTRPSPRSSDSSTGTTCCAT